MGAVVGLVLVLAYHVVKPACRVPCLYDKLGRLCKLAVCHHTPDGTKGAEKCENAGQDVYLVADKILRDKRYSEPAGGKEAGKGKRDKEVSSEIVIM